MNRTVARVTVLFFALAALLGSGTTTSAQRANARIERVNGREAVAHEVLVKFRRSPQADLLTEIRGLTNAEGIQTIGRAGLRRLRARALDVPALLQLLANHPDVLYAEPNYIVHTLTEPNDPSFPQLWGLRNTGQTVNGSVGVTGADIHAVEAWDVSLGSTAQVVAVVDTGIDYTHPDLAVNVWSAPEAFSVNIGGMTITCPAGSHGFNVITLTCNPMDDHNHGTHVSGTIGASGGNGVGVVGVNWTTQVMGIKFLDANGSGSLADAIKAVDFAIQAKRAFAATGAANVRVLSNSWAGGGFSQAMLDEINAANAEDMLFVAAAGNNGSNNDVLPTYPASYHAPNVIAVAATTNTDARAYFSNYGSASVHLGAPGLDVLSTTIGNSYTSFSGTSMATPHVSGAAALVLSHCAFGTDALKDALLSTVEHVPSLESITASGGRLDVNSAIRSCDALTTPPVLTALAGDGSVTLTWSGATGATAFNVKRSTTSGGPYTLIAPGVKPRSYKDTDLTNDTTYYYVVSATNDAGESADSNEASARPKIPSDLVVSAFAVAPKGGAGLPLALSVTIKNQGPGTAAPTSTRFYVTTSGTLGPTAIALEGASNVPSLAPGATSAAAVTVGVPAGVAPNIYFVFVKADADNVEAETVESNNTLLGGLVTIGPDLTITSLTGPSAADAGSTILVTDTVKNQGGGATAASATRFYLSTDAAINAGDVLLAGARSVPGLSPGATSAGSTSLLIPSTAQTGSYYLIAKADADNTEPETQETNNTAVKTLQIGGDLVVSALTVPSSVGAGSTILVTDTTANQGSGTVAASVTRFYLSRYAVLDASATPLGGERAVPALLAGAASTGATMLVIPSTIVTGNYYFIAKADADNAIVEAQEANNAAARSVTVGGDLVVSALTAPSSAGAGSTILVSDTTANQRAGAVAASITRFYLSANAVLDASDVLLTDSRMVPALAGNATSAGSTSVTLPSTIAVGTYYVIAKADADNTVPETEEANNTAVRIIQIGGDLAVSALAVQMQGAGGSIVVNETTTNLGGTTVAESVTRFYLSRDTILDASDTVLAARQVPALAAGGSSAASTTLPTIGVGAYYLIAKADSDNVVIETQEGNNTAVRQMTVGPDLLVAGLSVPSVIAAGATVTAIDITQNSGGDASGPSATRFYLSTNQVLDASDVLLAGSRAVPALAPGALNLGTTAITILAGTVPGIYYVIAVADADGAVTEAQENNNTRMQPIQVIARP